MTNPNQPVPQCGHTVTLFVGHCTRELGHCGNCVADTVLADQQEIVQVKFKRGLRTDGALEHVQISQQGFGELRLTIQQAQSLVEVLRRKLEIYGTSESRKS